MEALLQQLLQIILALMTLISSYMVAGSATGTLQTTNSGNSTTASTVATTTGTENGTSITPPAPTAPTSVSDAGTSTTGTSTTVNATSVTTNSGTAGATGATATSTSTSSSSQQNTTTNNTENVEKTIAVGGYTVITKKETTPDEPKATTTVSAPTVANVPDQNTQVVSSGEMVVGTNSNYLWCSHEGGIICPFAGGTETDFAGAVASGKTNGMYNINVWKPEFLDHIKNYGVFRFMDWDQTNDLGIVNWSERRLPEDPDNDSLSWDIFNGGAHYDPGLAYEWHIDLCNRAQIDCWINIPAHTDLSTDDYWLKVAQMFYEELDPNLRVWVEYSNETWNGIFEQSEYLIQRGAAESMPGEGGIVGNNPWWEGFNYHAYASIKLWETFESVFGKNSPRLVKVLAGQMGHEMLAGHFNNIINVPQYNPNGTRPDVYAIAPYLGDIGAVPTQADVDAALENVAHYKQLADEQNVPLIAYEGGKQADVNNQEIYDIYQNYLNGLSQYMDAYVNYQFSGGTWGETAYVGQHLDTTAYVWESMNDWIMAHGGRHYLLKE